MAGGSILLGHGVAPGGAWYNERLKALVVCTVFVEVGCGLLWLWQWCIKVSLFFLDKNDTFASHVSFDC